MLNEYGTELLPEPGEADDVYVPKLSSQTPGLVVL
jgi:hypothetical protein